MTATTLDHALTGDRAALRKLVDDLMPTVRTRVTRALSRWKGKAPPSSVDDLVQETFASLFADGARALRAFQPARGVPLTGFVGMIADHQVASILRSGKRNPWTEEPMTSEAMELATAPAASEAKAEAIASSREILSRIGDELKARLTPRGLELFEALLVDGRSVESVCASTGMTADAVYAWKSRLGKLVRAIALEIDREMPMSDGAAPRRMEEEGP